MRRTAIALVLVTASLLAACNSNPAPTPRGSAAPGTPVAASAPSALGSPAPTSADEVGPIVDGVPAIFGGLPVLRGDALRAAVAATTDDTPFLAGGWFQSTYSHLVSYCSAVRPPRAVDTCENGVLLYDQQVGWTRTELTGGDSSIVEDLLTLTADRPAVLLVHTHDPACAESVAKGLDCAHTAVLSTVEWMGPVATARPSPTPVGTPPATPISRARAIAIAEAHTAERAGVALRLRCLVVAPYSSVWPHDLPPPQPDGWVWSIVFVGGRWASDKVSLDYTTGAVVAGMGGDWVQSCLGDSAPPP
jgi:hypothetical protein